MGGCWRRVSDEGGSPLGAVLLLFSRQNLVARQASRTRRRKSPTHIKYFILGFTENNLDGLVEQEC